MSKRKRHSPSASTEQSRNKPRARRPNAKPDASVEEGAKPGIAEDRGNLPDVIVAVGASAGGLEAFSQVLEHLRAGDRLAVVFIQHLSPQHASSLSELLGAKTSMRVLTAANKMPIERGHVYVIPPNAQMEVIDGELHLLPRPTDRSQYTPVDFFMQSLARWAHDRAVGVILSGTASDGAAGVREIKALGGISLAQAPETAKYDGMPRAAIATGMVDLVLSTVEIAEHLNQIGGHPYLSRSVDVESSSDLPIDERQLRELFVALRRASGIDFKQYKTPTIKRRLLRRMALARVTEPEAYLRYVTENTAEAKALSQDLLIHVTRFFRDPESFGVIAGHVFSELSKDRGDDPVRIWVPGCATGEEAYSIGICLLETLGDRVAERRVQIFATDVSDAAINYARAGTYPASIAADVSSERLKRFFTKSEGGYRVIKGLRDMCVFARHDLTRDPPFSRLDLIVCRNVLIYLDVALQKRLITIFHYALRSHGFLMLGPAETPGPQSLFSVIDKKWRLFRKTPADVSLPLALPMDLHPATPPSPQAPPSPRPVEGKSVQDEATRLILDRYGPPGVVVDSNLQIIQFRGHTGPYLEAASGDPSLNILKMARGGLLHPLRTALRQARQRTRVVRKDQVQIQRNGDWVDIGLEVIPLATVRGEHYLVLFDESGRRVRTKASSRKGRAVGKSASGRETEARVSDLRRELAASREYMQSIIQELEAANEELQSANEEILSSNEELQSTNEELDTAKEELQSTNEELNTVNEELHSRNEELTRANSDMTNLLGSVDIPIVIVGSDLAVRRFTPRSEQLFNLIAGDVGRPIGQINPNFTCGDLEGLIRETIETITAREREVQDKSGRWLSLRIRPYKGVDNRLDGAVLSIIDIDATKRHQALVEHSRDHFRAIVNAIELPLVVLDDTLKVLSANQGFLEAFEIKGVEADGRSFEHLVDSLPGGAEMRELLKRVLDRESASSEVIGTPERRWRARAQVIPSHDASKNVLVSFENLAVARDET